jgi:hypothetical protein
MPEANADVLGQSPNAGTWYHVYGFKEGVSCEFARSRDEGAAYVAFRNAIFELGQSCGKRLTKFDLMDADKAGTWHVDDKNNVSILVINVD